ncbi:MAG: DUF1080 domain-containing protein [Sedimentisphaerales bacterium]|mgnify:CR=1 FL=1|jgi:hypothetical protein|nr:DUF1080 domain-containing protein [Sedimentisphaerales bacterium]NLT78367.1 DUF1080 domain-containing protein [Planctomycetota bacterium]
MVSLQQTNVSKGSSRTESWPPSCWAALVLTLSILAILLSGCRCPCSGPDPAPGSSDEADVAARAVEEEVAVPAVGTPEDAPKGILDLGPGEQVPLFDGQSLGQWKVTDFGGQGDVYVKDGAVYLEMGSYATGITWTGPVIRMNYEITLEAMRVEGTDFFCALTFPVADKPCTLVLGGWGGTLCGLSTIDYYDASENPTTTFYSFKKQTWYHVRLRVVPGRITAWLDGEQLVDLDTTDRRIDIRAEMDLCQPLGIATWVTTGAVRNIYLTKLPDPVL